MKNAYEDYLQAGGSLSLTGELNSSLYNVLNDSIDAFIEQVGGVFAYGATVAGNTTITSNDYAPEGLTHHKFDLLYTIWFSNNNFRWFVYHK